MQENLEGEVWRDVIGYEGLYQVSNMGRVYSMPRKWESGNGRVCQHNGKILKPICSKLGYKKVILSLNSKNKTKAIHQLVAEAFLGHIPCGFKLVVDHINDIKTDNRVENLQVVSSRFNVYKTQGNYSSMQKGVSWHKVKKKWQAQIRIDRKVIFLGMFDCELKASEAYQNKLKEIENGK